MKLLTSMAACTLIALTACSPFSKVQDDKVAAEKIDGSWSVLWSGGAKLEGLTPKPTIVINTSDKSISGFDGCNNYKGTYSFIDGKFKANVAGTRMACTSDLAKGVSTQMADLFTNGAEIAKITIMKGNIIVMKNSSAELRLAPTEDLNK